MQTLRQKLESNTQELLQEYLEKTRIWSENKFKVAVEHENWTYQQWVDAYPVPQRNFINSAGERIITYTLSRPGDSKRMEYSSIRRWGLERFTLINEASAEEHYNNSLDKLAFRLEEKGVTGTDFEVEHQRLGVNFEIVIRHSDGKVTKAWTIVASGEIIKPHYRFLIK